MADQRRNQPDQGQQSRQGGRRHDPDESTGKGESRDRSTREPASEADDRVMDTDELDSETAIESDLDDE